MYVDQTMAIVSAVAAGIAGIIIFIRRNWSKHSSESSSAAKSTVNN
ncbi:hypothetical protein LKD70_12390 [Ruminococcus sp. CLA-AA-H200]|uniref:LPXTG cell wall anchor domain-containing protein n=1 Tax=Ruminococcus turbiniformis TaxID=2881258 RepID=A0ABS8FYU8_9FIRM|nr:hypothetical protein [Ruminococcus turbiniformis]MCC2255206.1 hypothetical protein [Ruminococcus turbiniformis]